MHAFKQAILFLLFLIVSSAAIAAPAEKMVMIRDAEIEDYLADLTRPLFKKSGLNGNAIKIYLVNDDRFNAFVAGGQRVFLHTGLLEKVETPASVAGVIAHELGHIAGGHLARMRGNVDNASTAMILSYILGAAAAAGSGNAGAGAAVLSGVNNAAQRQLLKYSRSQEQAADQFAVKLLTGTGWGVQGLSAAMNIIRTESLWRTAGSDSDPYARSHPLTEDRLTFLSRFAEAHNTRRDAEAFAVRHARMRGKLLGFLGQPQTILVKLSREPVATGPLEKLRQDYARAIALYRLPDVTAAEKAMEPLKAQFPKDPYFAELSGQMALERGDVVAARGGYSDALALKPNHPLLQYGLVSSLMAGKTDAATRQQALSLLEKITAEDPDQLGAWRLKAQVYGMNGQPLEADLSLAELAARKGDRERLAFLLARLNQQKNALSKSASLRLADLQQVLQEWEE